MRSMILCAAIFCLIAACMLPASSQTLDEDKVTLTADNTRWYPDQKVTATGNVQAEYKDYKITSDNLDADLETNLAVFHGNVVLTSNGQTVRGEDLKLNLKTKEWSFENASSQIDPSAFQGRLTSPAFVHGAEVEGDGKSVKLEAGTLTTCDLQHPHYYFKANDLEIYPDSKIIAHKVTMVGLDKRLFTLGTLLIPIKGLTSNIFPQVGSTADEGMFLKTSYAYMANQRQQGFLKLDLMQNKGVGAGVDHTYKLGAGSGLASLYFLADRQVGGNNINGRFQHHQKLGTVDMNFTSDYRQNNYLYFPATTSKNWQLALTEGGRKANTALTFRNNSSSGIGSSENSSTSFRHIRQFTDKLNLQLSMDMRSYLTTGMPAADKELDSVFELRQRDKKFDLSMVASKRSDLDGPAFIGDKFYGGLDRLPEFTFETDSYRLGEKSFLGLPSRLQVIAGRYYERPAGTDRNRLLVQWDMMDKTFDIGSRNDLSIDAGIRQAWYANNMAQYVVKAGGTLTSRFNDDLRTTLSYEYQQPKGYSPFLFDYSGKYNFTRMMTDYQRERKLRWSVSTGYDFNSDGYPWQDVMFHLTAHPSDIYGFSLATGYDINGSKWRSLIGRVQVNVPDRIRLDVGTRYDLSTGLLNLANARADIRIGKLWRLEGITSWNGQMKKFDYRAFRLTRDLHCWAVSLTYNDETGFRADKGFSLDFRIKALPFLDRFGIGQYGQQVDTNMGEYYY